MSRTDTGEEPVSLGDYDTIELIETPAVLIDRRMVQQNIERYQQYCDRHGFKLRPHIKTHKLTSLALAQLDAGATGITAQKISEAEVMANGGVNDILITYNVLGDSKLVRLRALADRVERLSVVADNDTTVRGLSRAFATAGKALPVLVECDTGAVRCGVQTPTEAVALAQRISAAPGLEFAGLMTYPPVGGGAAVAQFIAEATTQLEAVGLSCPIVSSGGSPDMWHAHEVPGVTEIRIGTYIYNDRSLVERGTCTLEDCALTVLVTVVSTPTPGRAVVDAGSKALTSDLVGLQHYGCVVGHPDVRVDALSEEHGVLRWDDATTPFMVGDRLAIVPNHVCPVSNLFDAVWMTDDGRTAHQVNVAARGMVL